MTNTRGPLNSAEPTTSVLVGGVFNETPPAPTDGQVCAIQFDSEGNILVNVAEGGGGKTPQNPEAPTQVTVGVASTAVLGANTARTGLVLTNVSNSVISIGLGAAAVLNSGITLNPNGVWVMDAFTFVTTAINAIAASASSALAVQELQ
jgi:hypothetical protein